MNTASETFLAVEAKLELEANRREHQRQEYQNSIDCVKKEAEESEARAKAAEAKLEAIAQEYARENCELKELLEKERDRAEKLAKDLQEEKQAAANRTLAAGVVVKSEPLH